MNKKTGTRQYTRAVIVEIYSSHPGSLMHYLGLLEFPVGICDASHDNSYETYLIFPMKYDCDLITAFI